MRENQTLMKALAKKKIDENTRDWPSLLPELMYNLNTTFVSAINKTHIKAVFNFDPKLIRFESEWEGKYDFIDLIKRNLDKNKTLKYLEEIEDQENEITKNGDKTSIE